MEFTIPIDSIQWERVTAQIWERICDSVKAQVAGPLISIWSQGATRVWDQVANRVSHLENHVRITLADNFMNQGAKI